MDFLNDLDTVKSIRTWVMFIAAIAGIFSVYFFDLTNKLSAEKVAKDRQETEINLELVKAITNYVSMKSGDLEGMNNLIDGFKNSPHQKVKDEIQKYLDLGNDYVMEKQGWDKTKALDSNELTKLNQESLNSYESEMNKDIEILMKWALKVGRMNHSFDQNFKIYQIEKIRSWLNEGNHIRLVEEAKEKIALQNSPEKK